MSVTCEAARGAPQTFPPRLAADVRTYARHQRADGTIPTYFDNRKGSDWVNCMVYVADRQEVLADVMEK